MKKQVNALRLCVEYCLNVLILDEIIKFIVIETENKKASRLTGFFLEQEAIT